MSVRSWDASGKNTLRNVPNSAQVAVPKGGTLRTLPVVPVFPHPKVWNMEQGRTDKLTQIFEFKETSNDR